MNDSTTASPQEQQQHPQAAASLPPDQRTEKFKLRSEMDKQRANEKFDKKLYASGIVDYLSFIKNRASSLIVGIGEKRA